METEINIVEILKDKPVGLKFYSNTFGYISFNGVHKDKVYFFSEDTNAHSVKPNGKMYDGGECIIFPSKEMRDWEKFSWKKGDVLVNKDRDVHVIFEGFTDNAYTRFKGKHYLWKECDDPYSKEESELITSLFEKANDDEAQTYINTIEERLGGKLNLETLEIEKAQPEFKDWDFITIKLPRGSSLICVFKAENDENYYLHASLDSRGMITINENSYCSKSGFIVRLSTEEEKTAFFDALARKGKIWEVEKKKIIALKKKWTPKPFDRVITRNADDDIWTANIFSHMDSHGEYVTIGCVGGYTYCIPYNEETAKLIGTTNNVEG
jgi:hypothetical protein